MMTFIKPSITYLVAQHPLCKDAVLACLSWMVLMTFSPIHPRWVLEVQTHSFWCTLSDQSRRHPHSSHPSLSSPKSGNQLRKEEPWSLGSSAGSWANTHTAARQEAQQTSILFPGDCSFQQKGFQGWKCKATNQTLGYLRRPHCLAVYLDTCHSFQRYNWEPSAVVVIMNTESEDSGGNTAMEMRN